MRMVCHLFYRQLCRLGVYGAWLFLGLACLALSSPAAEATNVAASSQILQVGDVVKISLEHPEWRGKPPFEQRIKEDGTITLPYINSIQAARKSPSQLEKDIRNAYLEQKYYKHLSVIVMSTENRFFFVYGIVKMPGRYPYVGDLTVTRAIATAGGFTEFSKKDNVTVTRQDGTIERVDCEKAEKNPGLDLPVYPGDTIIVQRRWL
ncbi:MAG: polysaccharide export protein [Verrucomicrobiae bacterium]|nr:polysaccharide export protein [Verrucomicrobiae bacterium]